MFSGKPDSRSEQSYGFSCDQGYDQCKGAECLRVFAALTIAGRGATNSKLGDFFFTAWTSHLDYKGISAIKADLDRLDAIGLLKGVMQEAS